MKIQFIFEFLHFSTDNIRNLKIELVPFFENTNILEIEKTSKIFLNYL